MNHKTTDNVMLHMLSGV